MSKFLSQKYKNLVPYTPGEQPKQMKYIKLNTNESPFPPSKKAVAEAEKTLGSLQLYSDPEAARLKKSLADTFGVSEDEVLPTNGSDEILNFAFMAFCDSKKGAAFADITYGFYPVFAEINNIPYTKIPLEEDFTIDITKFFGIGKTIFIANPNAPTGIALSLSQIRQILDNNRDSVVVIDEAYVDFGAESCVPLIYEYDNLLVTQTFSKSRSMAGARLGVGIGCKSLIADLNAIKYSTNPYNVNSITMAAGIGALSDEEYTKENCKTIAQNREWLKKELAALGFEMTDSISNFVFAKHKTADGEKLYLALKQKGILVRHFSAPRICEYLRITIGTLDDMKTLVKTLKEILEEMK